MKAYRVRSGGGIKGLEEFERELPPPGRTQVRMRISAVSLNYRDILIASTFNHASKELIPCSDAAGVIVERGQDAHRFTIGDRVVGNFFPDWVDGPPNDSNTGRAFGNSALPGFLSEEVLVDERALVAIPDGISDLHAATVPCAGVTAWQALFGGNRMKPGDTVLLLGTGGVSIWALQLARATGLRVVITSSSDEKLRRARTLGAWQTVNYRKSAGTWAEEVRAMTGGGVDLALDVGGKDTLASAIHATRTGGTVAVIGGVSGQFGGEIAPFALTDGAKTLAGVLVGSQATTRELFKFMQTSGMTPIVDRVFDFRDARQAFEYIAGGNHFGKVVVRVTA